MSIVRLTANTSKAWLSQIAEIHAKELEVGFLSHLGIPFLRKLYQQAAQDENAILLVAIEENQVKGFVCGLQDRKQFIKNFILNHVFFLIILSVQFVFSLSMWKSFMGLLFSPEEHRLQNLPQAELFSFAVEGTAQGKGLGKALFLSLRDNFKDMGIPEMKIVASLTQPAAIKFYSKMGSQIIGACKVGMLSCLVFSYSL